jgi:hypothetical protein
MARLLVVCLMNASDRLMSFENPGKTQAQQDPNGFIRQSLV